MLKSLILPIIIWSVVSALGGTQDEANFAFEYGLLSTASSSLVIAASFDVSEAHGAREDMLIFVIYY